MEIALSVLEQEQAQAVCKASFYSIVELAGNSMTLVIHIHLRETNYLNLQLQSLPLANVNTSMKFFILQLSFLGHLLPHINHTMHLNPPSHLCRKITKVVFQTACCFTGNLQEHFCYHPGGGNVITD